MTWLYSWAMGRLPVLIVLAAVLGLAAGLYGLGRHHSTTRWESRWEARETAWANAQAEAQRLADEAVERQRSATIEAAQRFSDAQAQNVTLADRNRQLGERLRRALARPAGDLPTPAPDPAGTEPAGDRLDAESVVDLLRGISAFAEGCARSRDDLAAQVNALQDAWPR